MNNSICLAQGQLWIAAEPTESYPPKDALKAVPTMLRRRFNGHGKAIAATALATGVVQSADAIVYASQHGDIERTTEILQAMASGEAVSPTSFSLSVHNAIPGLLSIALKNHAPITSLAAGEEPLLPVLLEAAGLLAEGHQTVLCLLGDPTLPSNYSNEPSLPRWAMAFVVSQREGLAVSIAQCDSNDAASEDPRSGLLALIEGKTNALDIAHNQRLWRLVAAHA